MAQMSMPAFTTKVYEREDNNRVVFNTAVTTSGADTLPVTLTVTGKDLLAESFRTVGIEMEIDRGEGALRPMEITELPETISIRGSLEGYGARQVTFGWRDAPPPAISAAMRAARRARATGYRGMLGGGRRWRLLDGRVHTVDHASNPANATIVAQDQLLGLAQPLFYTLAVRSLKTREEIVKDICARHRIQVGPFAWANSGGRVVKEIVEAGGRTVGAFLAEFIAPTGCRYYQRNGKLCIASFSSFNASSKTIALSLIHDLDIRTAPPATDAPNAIRLSSPLYQYTGPDLTGTYVTEQIVPFDAGAGHVVRVAYEKQDKTTGAVTSVSPSSSPGVNPWSKIVTSTTYVGGNITQIVVETYGWKAPIAARQKRSAAGVLSHNDLFDCFHYAHDGSWRTQQAETFELISRVVTTRTHSSETGFLVSEYERTADYRVIEVPRGWIATGTNTENGFLCYVQDDGRAISAGRELFGGAAYSWEDIETNHYRDSSNLYSGRSIISRFTGTTGSPPIDAYISIGYTPGSVNVFGDPIYVFGPTAGLRYARLRGFMPNSVDYRLIIQTYSDVSGGAAHTLTTTNTASAYTYINPSVYTSRWSAYVNGTETIASPRPAPEMLTSMQVPQPSAETFRDRLRIVLNNGVVIQEAAENPWCENLAEQIVAAREVYRWIASLRGSFVTDVDFDLEEGNVITIPAHPKFGGQAVNLLIVSQEATVNPHTGQNAHVIDWRLDPPELAA